MAPSSIEQIRLGTPLSAEEFRAKYPNLDRETLREAIAQLVGEPPAPPPPGVPRYVVRDPRGQHFRSQGVLALWVYEPGRASPLTREQADELVEAYAEWGAEAVPLSPGGPTP